VRIAHLLGHSALNGVATSTHTLIQAQLHAGHEVMLVHPSPSWIEGQSFDRPVETLISHLKTTRSELRRVGYAVQAWGEDVVHAHGSRANKYAMIYRLVARTPVVMTAHARIFQIPWRFAHVVLAPSAPTAEYYRRRLLVPARNARVIPHLFDVGKVAPVSDESRAEARRGLGIRSDAFLLGSIGEICNRKNQIDMLLILKALVTQGVDAELLLIGVKGGLDEEEKWASLIADPAIASRIHMAGQRSDAQLLLHALDVYLCTSKVEEGPIATLEAMAAALPVVTSDVGYSSELIRQGQNGMIFPVGSVEPMAEACVALSREPELRARFGEEARRTISEKLTAESIVPQIDALYREAIARSGRPSRRA
jgi:glycosyltransferase involved in cell wall biosynthesis